ncbi:MAG: hypothetical protein JSU86_03850 [Phycisphaerales bacterium]|nr:MAG: hypothetical protein JSU86_03850 [Phycisphaerales bacterium]
MIVVGDGSSVVVVRPEGTGTKAVVRNLEASSRGGVARLSAAFAVSSLTAIPWFVGVSESYSTWAILTGLKMSAASDAHLLGATSFVVGHEGYEVDFWCTPSVLPLCGIALLWFAQQRPLAYLLTCVGFTVLSGMLIFGSTVLSIHLHQRGVDWVWAHYPGAILVYSSSLVGCLIFAEIRQGRMGRASAVAPEELMVAEACPE